MWVCSDQGTPAPGPVNMYGRMSEHTFFWSRLRWRFRGATMWPAFIVVTLLDGVILWRLPPVRTGLNAIDGVLLAVFGNLVLIAALTPWLVRRMAVRRVPPPGEAEREVLKDRVGTVLLVAGVFGCLAAGLAARPTVVVETASREENAEAVREYVIASEDAELERNLETANTVRLGDDYFRTCVARDDRRRYVCLFVDTSESPPRVARDPSAEPNSVYKVP